MKKPGTKRYRKAPAKAATAPPRSENKLSADLPPKRGRGRPRKIVEVVPFKKRKGPAPVDIGIDGFPQYAGSMVSAEKIFKIPMVQLKWAKRQGCPAFSGNRVHMVVIAWLKKYPMPEIDDSPKPPKNSQDPKSDPEYGDEALPEKNYLERVKLKKVARQLDLKYEQEAGLLVAKAEVKSTWAQAMETIMSTTQAFLPKDEYNAWARQLQSGLKGLDL